MGMMNGGAVREGRDGVFVKADYGIGVFMSCFMSVALWCVRK